MRITHTIQSLSKREAGLFYFLNELTHFQNDMGCEVSVVGLGTGNALEDDPLWTHVNAQTVPVTGPGFFPLGRGYSKILKQLKPDVIHCHGLWTYHALAVPEYCRKTKTPFIVSTHGMLEPWAWSYHSWKKRPIWWLWEKHFLRRAALFMATSSLEAQNIHRFGFPNSTAIIPAGVKLPTLTDRREKDGRETKTMLFLSRIHPKKGLLNLVDAWNIARPVGWKVVLAGPDCDNHLKVVKCAIQKVGLDASFEFLGPIYNDAKWALLKSCDIFVIPTFSENFGIVVAEALACGIPVITTTGTPWNELNEYNCGWWIDIGVEPLAEAIKKATSTSPDQRREMGIRGRNMVANKYSWECIGQKTLAVYKWILQGDQKPAYVS